MKYNFRLVVNVPARTYSVYVTPAGGVEQTVGTDFAFRTEQNTVTNLNHWGVTVASAAGTNTVCNFKLVPVVLPGACITTPAPATWVNTPFANQTGIFTVEFDATPSAAPRDYVMALSSGSQTAFSGFACLVRFNDAGFIDARNAGSYVPLPAVIPYSANVKYSFRLVVNVPAHTYSVFVTPAGGAEQTVGTDFAFRTEQNTVTKLDNWGAIVGVFAGGEAGTNTVCNFRVVP